MGWLHHLVLHFPISLAPIGLLLMFFGRVRRDELTSKLGPLLTYLATAFAVLAIATGLASAGHFAEAGGETAMLEIHRNLAIGAGASLVVTSAWMVRRRAEPSGFVPSALLLMLVVSTVLVLAAAHFGGEMLHPGMLPWSGHAHTHGPRSTQPAPANVHGAHEAMQPPAARSTPSLPPALTTSPASTDGQREATNNLEDAGTAILKNVAPAPASVRMRGRGTLPASSTSPAGGVQPAAPSQPAVQPPTPASAPAAPPPATGHAGH